MTWPGWMEVLPALGALLTVLAAMLGALWTLAKLLRPIMGEAAREACDELYKRLKGNDFRHIEEGLKAVGARIGELEGRVGALEGRMGALEVRMGALEVRMDSFEETAREHRRAIDRRLERFEARILEAVRVHWTVGAPDLAAEDG